MERPTRKKNRLQNYDYSQNGAYFITICTEGKKCCLSDIAGATVDRPAYARLTPVGKIVETAILGISEHYQDIYVEKYVIMPNHIHLLLMIDVPNGRPMVAPTVARVIKQMKGHVTKQIGEKLFQRSYHDHIIRDQAHFDMIWQYIDTNPVRWKEDCFYMEE